MDHRARLRILEFCCPGRDRLGLPSVLQQIEGPWNIEWNAVSQLSICRQEVHRHSILIHNGLSSINQYLSAELSRCMVPTLHIWSTGAEANREVQDYADLLRKETNSLDSYVAQNIGPFRCWRYWQSGTPLVLHVDGRDRGIWPSDIWARKEMPVAQSGWAFDDVLGLVIRPTRLHWAFTYLLRMFAAKLLDPVESNKRKMAAEEVLWLKTPDFGNVSDLIQHLNRIELVIHDSRWSVASIFPDVMVGLHLAFGSHNGVKQPEELQMSLRNDLLDYLADFLHPESPYPNLRAFVGNDEASSLARLALLLGPVGPIRALGHPHGHFGGLPSEKYPDGRPYGSRLEALQEAHDVVRYARVKIETLNLDRRKLLPAWRDAQARLEETMRILKARVTSSHLPEDMGVEEILTFKHSLRDVPLANSIRSIKGLLRPLDIENTMGQITDFSEAADSRFACIYEMHTELATRTLERLPVGCEVGGFGRGMGYNFCQHLAECCTQTATEWLKRVSISDGDGKPVRWQWLFGRLVDKGKRWGHQGVVVSIAGKKPPPREEIENGRCGNLLDLAMSLKGVARLLFFCPVYESPLVYDISQSQTLTSALEPEIHRLLDSLNRAWTTGYVFVMPTWKPLERGETGAQ